MFRVTFFDFAFLTTEADLKAKNTNAAIYSYQGLNLECGVPGLYWINFFSDEFAERLGLWGLPEGLGRLKHVAGGGVSLKFCEAPDQCRDPETLQKQYAAIERLGTGKFFDIRFPDRQVETLDWGQAPSRKPGL
jgi:hypothetical protein